MLGAPPIHRGAKISKEVFFFLLPILLQYYKFKMLHKKRSSHKTTILLHLLFCSKPFKPVLMKLFCFIPWEILSETSRRHCVLNSAPSRKKESVHIESSDIYSHAGKIYYT